MLGRGRRRQPTASQAERSLLTIRPCPGLSDGRRAAGPSPGREDRRHRSLAGEGRGKEPAHRGQHQSDAHCHRDGRGWPLRCEVGTRRLFEILLWGWNAAKWLRLQKNSESRSLLFDQLCSLIPPPMAIICSWLSI